MGLKDKIIEALSSFAKGVIENVMDWWEPTVINKMKKHVALETLHEEDFATEEVREFVTNLKKEFSTSPDTIGELADNFLNIIIGRGAMIQLEGIIGRQIPDDTTYTNNMFNHMAIVTDITLLSNILDVIIEVMSLGQIDQVGKQLREYLTYSGLAQVTQFGYGMIFSSAIGPLIQRELNDLVRPTLMDQAMSMDMRFKGLLTQEEFKKVYDQHGYTDEDTERIQNASWFYPQPQDFIRFAVREVFKPEIVKQYGYDEAFPIDEKIAVDQQPEWVKAVSGGKAITLGDAVKYARLDPEVLRWYWRAHWELPSATMGFEMLHRRIITQEDLRTLLQIGDMAPYWIDKVIDISYSPYTRVDARRMFETGTLDGEGFVSAMLDIGYNEERANNLLTWATLNKLAPERELTRSMIEKAFKQGLKPRSWILEQLGAIGYDTDEAELIVLLIESNQEAKEQEENIHHLSRLYVQDTITKEDLIKQLNDLGLSEAHKSKITDSADREIKGKLRIPSKTDLLGWLKDKTINTDQFTARMLSLGYRNEDIELYVASFEAGKEITP